MDGENQVSLKAGVAKLFASKTDGKWVSHELNTDETLWLKKDVSGTFTYFIVAKDNVMYKTTLEYTAPVKPIVAQFTATDGIGIAPESAGDAAGKIYAEYKLVANEKDISLASDNVEYIKVKVGEGEWKDLTANTDATLWFNVESEKGVNTFEVKTKDGNVYTATLDWDKEIKTATWVSTEREGTRPGTEDTYVEYKLMDGDKQVSLKVGVAKLFASKQGGKWVSHELNTDETLWLKKDVSGTFTYFIVAKDNVMYKTTLEYTAPVKPIVAQFTATDGIGIAPESAGDAAGKIYAEYKLVANEKDISLASDNVEYIKVKVGEGEWKDLTANTDATLWFNVESEKGVNTFEVKTKDGNVYTATLDWDKEIKTATWVSTEREGTRPGTEDTYVEYKLMDGDKQVSLKVGVAKLFASKQGGKWVSHELNTDETLWLKKDVSGTFTYFIVAKDNVMYKTTLEYTAPVKPIVAQFTATDGIGIAPESAGDAAGKIYAEYKLVANEKDISLASDNVEYIKVKVGEGEWKDLTANTDATLWFNVESEKGVNTFEVKTKDGNVYTATLDWDKEIKTATWVSTEREGTRPGTEDTYVEYKLMDGDKQVSLKVGVAKLFASKQDGKWVSHELNTDETLWLKKDVSGTFTYFIVAKDNVMYKTTLEYTAPVKPIVAQFTATDGIGIAPESAGDAAGKIYAEYKLVANEKDISLASDNVEYIKVKVGEGEWKDLTANTDATLWFNVESEKGVNTFEVKTKDGNVYTATLDWDKEIKTATWVSTEREGTRPGTEDTYVEYKLMDGDKQVSLKVGVAKLFASKQGGKWVSHELNTDETLWLKKDVSGTFTYFIVAKDNVMYKTTLEYTAPVKPIVAQFTATDGIGIAPESAGDAAGKIYAEYKLVANEKDISLASDNVEYIKVKVGEGEWKDLTANTDATLWFNVESEKGVNTFEVKTKDGNVYTATLDWDKEIKTATWVSTEREGTRPGTEDTYVEYKLMDGDKQVSLKVGVAKLFASKQGGKWVSHELNTDETLWLKKDVSGTFTYFIVAKDNVMYKTTLEYTAPVKPIVAQFTATDGIGIAPESAGDAAGKIYAEYKLVANEKDISLASDNVEYIKVKVGEGEWKDLTANTDATLWFNVESEKGVNTFEVKTKDGNVYTATLDWDKEIKTATWVSTEREGTRPGTEDTYVEYKLMDGDKQVSLKVGVAKLFASKQGGKWVSHELNTDETLWLKKDVSGTFTYFIVAKDNVMYKTTLEYTAPVKPIVAQFTATDGIGIAPESAGDAAGKIYAEYKLVANEKDISLASDNVEYIKVKVGEGEWKDLTANTDATLWFNVESEKGVNTFEVKTKDGNVYTATLDWDKEIKTATWVSTEREGTRPGTEDTYVEYKLMDGDKQVSLKVGVAKLFASKQDGKWVSHELNTDETLWLKKDVSGTFTYFIVAKDNVMYKTTLEYTAPVKPIVAQFTATDGIGIAPESAGDAAGKIYAEYKLVANEKDISLASDNVEYIKVKVGEGEWKDLTANTDATLWFNVESEKGVNTFEVKTKDGNVYTATLDWDKEIKTATWVSTEREGTRPGTEDTYVEYKLMDGDKQVSLKVGVAKLFASKQDGKWVSHELNTDETLWLKKDVSGTFTYFIVAKDNVMYKTTLEYTAPVKPIVAQFTATDGIGIAPESAGDAAGKIYAEYKLVANEKDISLASDNVEYIKVKVGEGEWKDLTANTDATLWFNVESEKGVNTFEVKTKDGNVYTATLDWDKEIKTATWVSTEREGTRPGTEDTYVEYKLMDGDKQVSLKVGVAKLFASKQDGKWVSHELNTDETLWLKKDVSGTFTYFIVAKDNVMYKTTLEYTAPVKPIVAQLHSN
jgi:hypothetical protein